LIVKQSKFVFAKDQEFADVTQIETNVLDLLRKDKRITPEVIAETLDLEVDSVKEILKRLSNEGRISIKITKVGQDEVIERTLTEPLKKQTDKKPETLNFKILYSYEGPEDNRNRDFCARLLEMNKLWSRSEIESMSMRLGYSVWDRRGGFWNDNGDVKIHCRHNWSKVIVMKKK
jgi:DNA-binding Lrp family transcriptional regulator